MAGAVCWDSANGVMSCAEGRGLVQEANEGVLLLALARLLLQLCGFVGEPVSRVVWSETLAHSWWLFFFLSAHSDKCCMSGFNLEIDSLDAAATSVLILLYYDACAFGQRG